MLVRPSMVFMLPHLANNRIDFISVGTNDLTQYIPRRSQQYPRGQYLRQFASGYAARTESMIAQEAEKMASIRFSGEMAGDPMCVAIPTVWDTPSFGRMAVR